MILIYGSTASGKSQIAEDTAVKLAKSSKRELVYLATMENKSAAAAKRIEHHRKLRKGKGFTLIEEMYDPSARLDELKGKVVLLECVSNLLANVMFEESDTVSLITGEASCNVDQHISSIADKVFKRIISMCQIVEKDGTSVVIVTNNIFAAGKNTDIICDAYMRALGLINIRLAAASEQFIEVTAGLMQIY